MASVDLEITWRQLNLTTREHAAVIVSESRTCFKGRELVA